MSPNSETASADEVILYGALTHTDTAGPGYWRHLDVSGVGNNINNNINISLVDYRSRALRMLAH